MNKILSLLVRAFIGAVNLTKSHSILARLSFVFVTELQKNGETRRAKRRAKAGHNKDLLTLLVLDMGRFRGDEELLQATGKIRCLRLSARIRQFMITTLVPASRQPGRMGPDGWIGVAERFAQPEPGSRLARERKQYREFLRQFLPKLYDLYGIQAVINNDDRFMQDRDILQVSSESGYPHICFYREAMHITANLFENARQRHVNLGKFTGDLIAVQNQVTMDMFIASGYAPREKIRICGCMRMDSFLRRIRQERTPVRAHKRITFFTIPHEDGFFYQRRTIDFRPVSERVMRCLAEVATRRPDVEIVVKLKDLHAKGKDGGQLPVLENAMGRPPDSIPNLRFETNRMAGQDLILSSSVVCAMQSTVVLEAAIAGRPVILPFFDDFMSQDLAKEIVFYFDQRDWFETPTSQDALIETILKCIDDPSVSSAAQMKHREMFEAYVSPLDQTATDNFIGAIKEAISMRQQPAP